MIHSSLSSRHRVQNNTQNMEEKRLGRVGKLFNDFHAPFSEHTMNRNLLVMF